MLLPGVQVTPSTLVRQAQHVSGGSHDQIARALGARYLVEGLLIRLDSRIRVHIEVIEAPKHLTVLAQAYEGSAQRGTGWPQSHDEIVNHWSIGVFCAPRQARGKTHDIHQLPQR